MAKKLMKYCMQYFIKVDEISSIDETFHRVLTMAKYCIYCVFVKKCWFLDTGLDSGLTNEENGQWRREIQPLQQATALIEQRRGGNRTGNLQEIRNKLTEYISGVGAVGWQDNYL
ncbi:hypothetical protein Ddc_22815 [Ditylenchus destructor]|nr:hypothetical protein Ddc_22815 [Ditylenchus destructor]